MTKALDSRQITVRFPKKVADWLDTRPGKTTTEKLLALAQDEMEREEEARIEAAFATLTHDPDDLPCPNEAQLAAAALMDPYEFSHDEPAAIEPAEKMETPC